MRQLWYWGWVLLGLVVVGSLSPVTAHADYRISAYRTQIDLHKNGNANLTQHVTYQFDDDYHGVFVVQDLRGIKGGRLTGVTTQLNGQPSRAVSAATTGATNTYQLTQSAERLKAKVYRPVTDGDTLRVTYHLALTGVVTNYADTAELNWKVIGTGWEVPLRQVKVTLQLPATRLTQLQAWTHGPLTGHTQVDRQRGRVTLTVPQVAAKTAVESHLLFPTSVTPQAPRVAQKKKAAVQRQEARLAQQANAKRQRQRWLVGGSLALLVVATLIVAGLDVRWFCRHPGNRYPHPIPIPHSFDVPTVAPAVAESLVDEAAPNTNALTGEILLAASHGQLSLTAEKQGRHQTMRLTRKADLDNSFLTHCFQTIGQDGSFTLADLKQYGKKDQQGRLGKWFHQWQEEVNRDVEPYQDADNVALRQRYLTRGLRLTLLLVLTAGVSWVLNSVVSAWVTGLSGLGLIVLWVSVRQLRRRIDRNNAEGLILVNDIGGFRRMLKDIGNFNTAKIGDLILWEDILPYAAAFGLSKQVIAKLKVDFGADALAAGFVGFYIGTENYGFADFGDAINSGISGSLQVSGGASSTTGGSGGFSGGSSGGFGGGSGGGAF
ncbi:membrane protein [Levilactobacillus zymae]|uniref:Membrane protein n=1 Tax=Levilactobacillus zymae TaxID=267363 RepID=A0ABQ0X038_9LACO|nr:DUF2207 domain-containing protein [Levilactobacillus zymae]KRL16359.1 hypothetical protein FD38_GL000204 [Levilactobacillus zymae DSM 19395]QFR61949.1 DUF2207 domain-containing protein [Levilactobacillus zymae]GEO72636.1 membrane protein [Levilactobacillus zymae]